MKVKELNRLQLVDLKQAMIENENAERGEGTSWDELARADELVSDQKVFDAYSNTEFVPEDFAN